MKTVRMISAKLIKSLEKEGFSLEFPDYTSNEERIIDILKEENERLLLALPLLLQSEFDYKKIISKLKPKQIKIFNKLIIIANHIFEKEKIDNAPLKSIIKEYSLKDKIPAEEGTYYYDNFKYFQKNKEGENEKKLIVQTDIRSKLNLNQSLSTIFSPGKQRIMEKIFKHESLTNTELKYYYRSIRPLLQAILNENLRDYARIIEAAKKYT